MINVNKVNDDMYVNRMYTRIGHAEDETRPKEGRWMYCGGDTYKRLRGRAARRRDRAISDTLKQVHKPWHSRSTEDVVSDAGTILFDLT